MRKKTRDTWMVPMGDCRVREITEDELKYLRSLDPSLPLVPLRPIGESVSEHEKTMRLKGVIADQYKELERYRARLDEIKTSEERLAEIVRRSLELRIFVYDHPKVVANDYYVDAKVALEKRPNS